MGVQLLGFPAQPFSGMNSKEGCPMEKQITVIEKAPSRRQPKLLLKALWRSRQTPEVRQEKIKSLANAIHTNTYRIDCRKLADCLITSLLLGFFR
jgi:hypothetical protein